jgi:phospholipase C
MGYFDGNTVTAMWNYANHFALNDNTYTSQFGPSTPGAINLISGQTNGFAAFTNVVSNGSQSCCTTATKSSTARAASPSSAMPSRSAMSAPTPPRTTSAFAGKNIGDLLNAKNITWGWFQGGFNLG